MLVTHKVAAALEEHREDFGRVAEETLRQLQLFENALARLSRRPTQEIEDRLRHEEWPGARPTQELNDRGLVISFRHRWHSAQEARSWALDRIRGVATIAVDGSQVAASKEFGVPLGLVQVAWFENHHDPDRPYVKNVRNEIVLPGDSVETDEYAFAESKLNLRRFTLEMQVAAEHLRTAAKEPASVVLIDGTLVLSFIGRLAPPARFEYLHALFDLLDASSQERIPVVGFVDLSFGADLVTMLKIVDELPTSNLFDAQILMSAMNYFDRTAAFVCARGDVLPHYHGGGRNYSAQMCFTYLKVGQDRLPARIDFPGWILQAGMLDHVVDVIRAEILVGTGYPYALETADAAAVLTTEDRISFYRLFHEFANASNLAVSLPAKSISKMHRR